MKVGWGLGVAIIHIYCGMPGLPCLRVLLMFLNIDEEICLERLESYICKE